MFCKLYVSVVLICSIMVVDIHAQNSFISKSIILTTLIGETVEFNCSEYIMESQNSYTQLSWFKNEKLRSYIMKDSSTKSLDGFNNILRITNVTHEDAGTYKCTTFNQSHYDSSIYTLIVKDLPELKPYYVYTSNITLSMGLAVFIRCMGYMYDDSENYNNQNHLYFKDGRPLFLNKWDTRMMVIKNFDLKIDKISEGDNGTYKCVSSNKFRIDYAVTYLNVVGKNYGNHPPYFTDKIVNQTKHLNENFFLPYEKPWFKNDKPIKSSEENTHIKFNNSTQDYEIKNLTFEDAGNYTFYLSWEYHTINLHYSLNIIDRPDKLSFRLFNSNISLIIGETFELKCHIFQSTENYTTWYSWKKNGEKLVLNKNTKNMYFEKYQSILIVSNLTSNESGIYECEAESYYHKVYSAYSLTTTDKPNNIEQVNSSFFFDSTYVVIFLLIGAVTLFCCVLWLRRKRTTTNDSEANKLQCLNGNPEKWNADSGIEEQICESPYDNIIYEMINSPLNRSTMSGDNSGLHLENSIEKQKDVLQCDNQWDFPTNRLKLGKQLGSGAFGEVFMAEAIGLTNKMSTTVAVKKVKTVTDPLQAKALIDEMEIMFQIGKHINLVNVLGTCKEDNDNNLMLILEYCRHGNLSDYLLKQRDGFINHITSDGLLNYDMSETEQCHTNDRLVPTNLNYTGDNVIIDEDGAACSSNYHGDDNHENNRPLCTHDLLSWSFQIARGMEYLSSKRILHRDLATRNILLADDNIVKICDFGLAKTLIYQNQDTYTMTNNVRLPWKWMAIESLFDHVFSTQSDVWSFGIVLWELFSLAETPYPNIQSFTYLCEKLIRGYRMEQPKYANHEIYNIMLDCWKTDPKSRPSFSDLHKRFNVLIQSSSKNHYLNLNEEFIRANTKTSTSINQIENIISHVNRSNLSGLRLKVSKQSKSNDKLK